MKVCVLLAAYNGERFISEQMQSISAQTMTEFEVLYQDDGSTDRTEAILAEWSGKDARFHPAKEQGRHLGPAGNFISLLSQADSDLMVLCDQDDIWEKEKLSKLLQAYEGAVSSLSANSEASGKNCAQRVSPILVHSDACAEASGDICSQRVPPILVHSDASVMDQDGGMLHPSFFRLQGWDPRAIHLNQLLVQNNATGCLMMLNRPLRDLVVQYGDPSRMFMHDWFIVLTAAAFGKVVFVNEPLTRYRQHGENAIGASRKNLIQRGFEALKQREKAKERVALTYSHSEAFLQAYGEALPSDARKTADDYLSTQHLPKLQRLTALRRQGCLMQSPVTRMGQLLFG